MQSENLAHIMHSNSTSFRNKAYESTHAVVVIKNMQAFIRTTTLLSKHKVIN